MSQVVSFAEESCWDGDKFRSVRREICFVLFGFGARLKKSIRREFTADFGLWYDQEDEWLIELLKGVEPDIDWGRYIFFKKLDHSAINIYDPEDGGVVGSIVPRGRTKKRLSGEITGANVIHISLGREYRAARLAREQAKARRREERCGGDQPEDV